jgi:hypothetical protein
MRCRNSAAELALCSEFEAALVADPEGASTYAAEVLARKNLPPGEYDRLKEERAAMYRKEWMSKQPVTEKQLTLLAHLGFSGPAPESRLAASAAIASLLHGGGEGKR